MTNQEQIQKLVAQIASEKDAEKKKELLAEACKLIAAIKASEHDPRRRTEHRAS